MQSMSKSADKAAGKVEPGQSTRPSDAPPTQPFKTSQEMRAATWQGSRSVSVDQKPKPEISHPKDVLIKVTACSICSGSDGHMYAGEMPGMDKGFTLGHECMGQVEAVGQEVKKLKVGDRVVVAFDIACGECNFCKREEYTGCTASNDSKLAEKFYGHRTAAIFGYGSMLGNVDGSQAEYVRVPYGEINCFPIPDEVSDDKALFLSDVACTSLHACEIGKVEEGDTVVIFGLGPVGLLAARWCQIKKAKRVIGVDMVPERLKIASEVLHIETLDRSGKSSNETVEALQAILPPEGADVAIEAVGYRFPISVKHKAMRALGAETDTPEIIDECLTIIRPFGNVSIIGDYIGYANLFPIGKIMFKHATVASGQCPCQKYWKYIMEKIQDGEFDPSFIISHRIGLEDVPEAYEKLHQKQEGYIKVFIRP
jgi:threonine dehydrogenase-like Zn-dependent dehydrogenase